MFGAILRRVNGPLDGIVCVRLAEYRPVPAASATASPPDPAWPPAAILAERVRFELTGLSSSGFQDRRNRPLCHLSAARTNSLPRTTVRSPMRPRPVALVPTTVGPVRPPPAGTRAARSDLRAGRFVPTHTIGTRTIESVVGPPHLGCGGRMAGRRLDSESAARQPALSGSERRTIGLLVGQGTGSYDHGLYEGVRAAAAARDLNVVNLMCGSLDSTLWNPFEGQQNLLFSLPSKVVFDGLVLIPSILYNYATPARVEQVLACYRDIPTVSISEAVPGCPGVFADSSFGVRELVRHSHEKHGKRRFAFISGPAANNDALDRLRGFLQGIMDCGLPVEPEMIFEGNFWWTGGRDGAHHFFGKDGYRPDALICANDYMAYGAREVLQELGLRVPEDVALAGFDNDPDSRFANPPLTTIEQPLDDMADRAVEVLLQKIQGREVASRIELPTRTIYRRSCGCHSGIAARVSPVDWEREIADDDLQRRINSWVSKARQDPPLDAESRSALLDSLYDILSMSSQRGKISEVRSLIPALLDSNLDGQALAERAFRDGVQAVSFETKEVEVGLQASKNSAFKQREVMAIQNIVSVYGLDEMFDMFVNELPALGVTTMFLNLFPRPFAHDAREPWKIPGRSRCIFAYVDGERLTLPASAATFRTSRLVPDVTELAGKRRNLISMSCFFREEVYGFMVFESDTDDMVVLGNLANHVSSAYWSILGYRRLEKSAKSLKVALRQLEASNRKLNELSTRDAMTGLYNRRGFELIGEKLHDLARRNKSDYVLFFADMDGVKVINDTWGHKAGDEAIVACADILRRNFRVSDVVARLGGDEFTMLTSGSGSDSPSRVVARLEALLRQYNDSSGRLYRVELSVGYVLFSACPGLSFAEIMAKADAELYRRKMERKRAKGVA